MVYNPLRPSMAKNAQAVAVLEDLRLGFRSHCSTRQQLVAKYKTQWGQGRGTPRFKVCKGVGASRHNWEQNMALCQTMLSLQVPVLGYKRPQL